MSLAKSSPAQHVPGFISRTRILLGNGGVKPPKQAVADVRIGILGAARVAPLALLAPAMYVPNVQVVSVAARQKDKATAFARKHGLANAYGSYEELVNDPAINAVYVPSPNGLHYKYALMALRAGKHVLCEKPLCANAAEAAEMVRVAKECDRLLMEATHSFHHPVSIRAREIVRSGELGEVVSTYGSFRLPPIFPGSDIRYGNRGTEPKLAGGGLMDTGAYAVNATRFYVDATIVGCAEAKLHEAYPQIDSRATATLTLRLKDGTEVPGVVESAIAAPFPWLSIPRAKVMCANGTLEVVNFLLPSMYHAINVYDKAGKLLRTERHYGAGQTSYQHQLETFAAAVRAFQPGQGGLVQSATGGTADDPVNTMHGIDSIYLKAGWKAREGDSGFRVE